MFPKGINIYSIKISELFWGVKMENRLYEKSKKVTQKGHTFYTKNPNI